MPLFDDGERHSPLRQRLEDDAADEAGISEMKVEIDISDEFKKSIEQALGRSFS